MGFAGKSRFFERDTKIAQKPPGCTIKTTNNLNKLIVRLSNFEPARLPIYQFIYKILFFSTLCFYEKKPAMVLNPDRATCFSKSFIPPKRLKKITEAIRSTGKNCSKTGDKKLNSSRILIHISAIFAFHNKFRRSACPNKN